MLPIRVNTLHYIPALRHAIPSVSFWQVNHEVKVCEFHMMASICLQRVQLHEDMYGSCSDKNVLRICSPIALQVGTASPGRITAVQAGAT
jgi:hypothetical protein